MSGGSVAVPGRLPGLIDSARSRAEGKASYDTVRVEREKLLLMLVGHGGTFRPFFHLG